MKKIQFPIAGKLIIVTTSLLLAVMIPVAIKTSDLFKEVSKKREEDSNRSQADARANEIEETIRNLIDKTKVLGSLYLKDKKQKTNAHFIFTHDHDFINFTLLEKIKNKTSMLGKFNNDNYLEGYKLDLKYLNLIEKKYPLPIAEGFAGKIAIMNRSTKQGAPIISFVIPLVKNDLGKVTHVATADFQLNKIQKNFSIPSERTIFLIDKFGNVIAHPNEKLAMSASNIKNIPVVKKALKAKMSKGQLRYYNSKKKEFFISAYSKTSHKLTIISEAPESIILEPARHVQRQVFFITGLVLSGSLFIIFLFSLTLTRPIEKLVALTKYIAAGNFNIVVSQIVKSRDEVGTLSLAFDSMLSGLRERDKVKNLFNKFHGSSVAEDLLKGEIKVGGSKKKVVVLFSDIRSFTSFSENRTPEEVVTMLNEYFTEMVSTIYTHNGIVDKFIGDAIMAVWGAPKSTGNDTYNAVNACIGMRIKLGKLNNTRKSRGEEEIKIGMGLHTGEAISGTIGSEDRMEYTVIGDTVNMASRIEAATKAFGTDLLVSEDLIEEIKDKFILENAGEAEVKGKSDALKLFKIKGYIENNGNKVMISTPYSDFTPEAADKIKTI